MADTDGAGLMVVVVVLIVVLLRLSFVDGVEVGPLFDRSTAQLLRQRALQRVDHLLVFVQVQPDRFLRQKLLSIRCSMYSLRRSLLW